MEASLLLPSVGACSRSAECEHCLLLLFEFEFKFNLLLLRSVGASLGWAQPCCVVGPVVVRWAGRPGDCAPASWPIWRRFQSAANENKWTAAALFNCYLVGAFILLSGLRCQQLVSALFAIWRPARRAPPTCKTGGGPADKRRQLHSAHCLLLTAQCLCGAFEPASFLGRAKCKGQVQRNKQEG